jgi:hypothetical protein
VTGHGKTMSAAGAEEHAKVDECGGPEGGRQADEGLLGEATSGGEEFEVIGDSVELRAIALLEIPLDFFDAASKFRPVE